MEARLLSESSRTAARQSVVARRLARREWARQQNAQRPEQEAGIETPLLARLRERFMARTDATEEQFAHFLPRLLTHLQKNDPALADRLMEELALIASPKGKPKGR